MRYYYKNLVNQQYNHLVDAKSRLGMLTTYDLPIAVRDILVDTIAKLDYAVDICDIIRDACTDSNEG